MATSTAGTYLYYKPTPAGVYTKLLDIMTYPDMGSTPNKLDTTDLSALKMKTSIFGLQEIPDLTFEANYDETAYETISALTGSYEFKLGFGTADAEGAFEWEGQVRIFVMGGGVDEVRKMQVTVSAETEITKVTV